MSAEQQEIEPGYEFQEEFAVELDHMGEGALKFALVTLLILLVVIIGAVQWAKVEGQRASAANTVIEPPPAIRTVRADAAKKLTQYDVLDAENGVYQIPIERAMALEANEHAED
jgi:hypothetical protein